MFRAVIYIYNNCNRCCEVYSICHSYCERKKEYSLLIENKLPFFVEVVLSEHDSKEPMLIVNLNQPFKDTLKCIKKLSKSVQQDGNCTNMF